MRDEKKKILFLDDEEGILNAILRVLRKSPYEVIVSSSFEEVFKKISEEKIAVLVSDERMPVLQGHEVLKKAKEISPQTIRILLTGYADIESSIKAVNEGAIFRFLTKPWNEDTLLGALQQAVAQYDLIQEHQRLTDLTYQQNKQLQELNETLEKRVENAIQEVRRLNKELEKAFLESVKIMGGLSEMSNIVLGGHSKRVARLSGGLAKQLGFETKEIFHIQVAAFLHDIGKIGLSLDAKLEELRQHPERGAYLVNQVPNLQRAALFIKHHHELLDGSGYPDQLSGDQIPVGSQIIGLIDAYDKKLYLSENFQAQTPTKVIQELKNEGNFWKMDLILALQAFLSQESELEKDAYEVEIDLRSLKIGMILSRPLQTRQGKFVLGADFKIDEQILNTIQKRHLLEDPLRSEVFVYRRSIVSKN